MISADLLKGVDWSDVPFTGLVIGIQTSALLFALLIVFIRYRFFAIKGK